MSIHSEAVRLLDDNYIRSEVDIVNLKGRESGGQRTG